MVAKQTMRKENLALRQCRKQEKQSMSDLRQKYQSDRVQKIECNQSCQWEKIRYDR